MLNWYVFNPGAPIFTDAAASCSQQSGGKYQIKVNYLPAGADGQRQQLVRRLAADDSALDILGLDVTWTPEFAEAKWIEPWPAEEAKKITDGTLDAMVKTAMWKGKLYSAPLNTNTQLLWYRKDLVPTPPKTWAEMITMSEKLSKDGKPHFVETQGAQYEGFTVWFNTMVASAGGQILSKDGSKAELGAPALAALKTMKTFATSVAADPSFSNQMEDANRLAFESGTAPFELNYPFIYPSAKDNAPKIFKNLAWTTYPRLNANEPAHVTIGGNDLAVSAFSPHKQLAFSAIECLRGPKNQVTNALKGGLPPVLTDLYKNPSVAFKKDYPFYKDILTSLEQASVRPLSPAYQNLSILISTTLSPADAIQPQQNLDALKGGISDALQSKGLIP